MTRRFMLVISSGPLSVCDLDSKSIAWTPCKDWLSKKNNMPPPLLLLAT